MHYCYVLHCSYAAYIILLSVCIDSKVLRWTPVGSQGQKTGFIWVRAPFPRHRHDQLMRLGWKVLLSWVANFIHLLLIVLAFNRNEC